MASFLQSLRRLSLHWRVFFFFMVPALLCPIPLVLGTPSAKAGYILLLSSIFLVLEILPMPATVLFSLFLISFTGLQSTTVSAKTFGSDTMFMFMSVLILAISIEETKLHNRLALLTLRAIGVSSSRLILGFIVISGVLSMWMSNTAVTLMILPIATAVSETLTSTQTTPVKEKRKLVEPNSDREVKGSAISINEKQAVHEAAESEATVFLEAFEEANGLDAPPVNKTEKGKACSPLTKALQLCTCYGANIGGLATLIGAYPNLIFKMSIEKLYGTETGLNFLSYFLVCGPVSFLSLLLTWIVFSALYIPNWICFWRNNKAPRDDDEARTTALGQKIKELGRASQAEITVIVLFSIVIVLWLTRDPRVVPGWGSLMAPRMASDSLPAILAAVLLFVLPRDYGEFFKGRYIPVLTWKQVVSKFPWELLIFVGGITTITAVADSSGLINALARLAPDLSQVPPVVLLAAVCVVVSTLTECMSNSVITSILLPILANVSEDMELNPMYLMLAVALSSQFAFMVPFSSFPTLIVYNYGNVTMRDMARSGIGPKIACLIFLVFSLEVLGSVVLDMKSFPSWAEVRRDKRLGSTGTPTVLSGLINGSLTSTFAAH